MTKRVTKLYRKCTYCGSRFGQLRKGRTAKYCSRNCRQRAYEARVIEREVSERLPMHVVRSDVDAIQSRDEIRTEVVRVLQEFGILLATSKARPAPPKLTLVKDEGDDTDSPA